MSFIKSKSNLILLFLMILTVVLTFAGYVQMSNSQAALHQALGVYGAAVARMFGQNTTGMTAIWYEGGEIVESTFNTQSGILLGIGIGFGIGSLPFALLWHLKATSKGEPD